MQGFSSTLLVASLLIISVSVQKLDESHMFILSLTACALVIFSEKSFPVPTVWRMLPVFFSL